MSPASQTRFRIGYAPDSSNGLKEHLAANGESTVNLLEALGSEIMVHFRIDAPRVDSGDPDAVEEAGGETSANAVGRFNPRSMVRPGQTAEIAVSNENLHFFDFDTREAIWD